jgi:hypothetical protein
MQWNVEDEMLVGPNFGDLLSESAQFTRWLKRRKSASARLGRRYIVGEVIGGDTSTGAASTGRQDKMGGAVVSQGGGKYAEDSSRGRIWMACDQNVGVTVQTSPTTTGIISLYNPPGSQVSLEVLKVAIGYFSGTLPSGYFAHAYNLPGTAAPSAGTLLTPVNGNIGNRYGRTVQGACRTGATVVAGIIMYPFVSSFAELATTANGLQQGTEDVDGAITIEPGGTYQVVGCFATGGTTPKVSPGIVWKEKPII